LRLGMSVGRCRKARSRDIHYLPRGIRCDDARDSFLIKRSGRAQVQPFEERKGTTVKSAWPMRHELTEDACPECQGSTYVPSRTSEERMVDECPKCRGTGTNAAKRAA